MELIRTIHLLCFVILLSNSPLFSAANPIKILSPNKKQPKKNPITQSYKPLPDLHSPKDLEKYLQQQKAREYLGQHKSSKNVSIE